MREKKGKPITESPAPSTLLGLLATMSPMEEGFPMIEDYPPEPVDLDHHFGGLGDSRAPHTRRSD